MTIRLGILGCGLISEAHGIAARKIGDRVKIVACADTNRYAADRFLEEYRCERNYSTLPELLTHPALDGLIIATWPADHYEHLVTAIEAGQRYILCEKSLTITSASAIKIWRLAREKHVTIIEAFMYIHDGLIAKLDDLKQSSNMGPLDWVRARFSVFDPGNPNASPEELNWRFRKEVGGGAAWDITCYAVNACSRYAASLPKSVVASAEKSTAFGTIDRLFAVVEYENGVRGVIESSMNAVFSQQIELVGAQKRLLIADSAFTRTDDEPILEYTSRGFGHVENLRHDDVSLGASQNDMIQFPAYHTQLVRFVDVVSGIRPPDMPLAKSVANIATIEAIVRSSSEGRQIQVELCPELKLECVH